MDRGCQMEVLDVEISYNEYNHWPENGALQVQRKLVVGVVPTVCTSLCLNVSRSSRNHSHIANKPHCDKTTRARALRGVQREIK